MAKIEYQATALPGSGNDLYRAAFNAYATAGKNLADAFDGLIKQGQDWRDTQLNQYIASQYDANNLNSINEAIKNASANPAFSNASAQAWENINKNRGLWNQGLNFDNLNQDAVKVASANNRMETLANTAMTPDDIRKANTEIQNIASQPEVLNSRAAVIPKLNLLNETLLNGKAQRTQAYANAKRMADEDSVYDCREFITGSLKQDMSNLQEVLNQASAKWGNHIMLRAADRLGLDTSKNRNNKWNTDPYKTSTPTPLVSGGQSSEQISANLDALSREIQATKAAMDKQKKQQPQSNNNSGNNQGVSQPPSDYTSASDSSNVYSSTGSTQSNNAYRQAEARAIDNLINGSSKLTDGYITADNNSTNDPDRQKALAEQEQKKKALWTKGVNNKFENAQEAQDFIDLMNSPEGQDALQDPNAKADAILALHYANGTIAKAKQEAEESGPTDALSAISNQDTKNLLDKVVPKPAEHRQSGIGQALQYPSTLLPKNLSWEDYPLLVAKLSGPAAMVGSGLYNLFSQKDDYNAKYMEDNKGVIAMNEAIARDYKDNPEIKGFLDNLASSKKYTDEQKQTIAQEYLKERYDAAAKGLNQDSAVRDNYNKLVKTGTYPKLTEMTDAHNTIYSNNEAIASAGGMLEQVEQLKKARELFAAYPSADNYRNVNTIVNNITAYYASLKTSLENSFTGSKANFIAPESDKINLGARFSDYQILAMNQKELSNADIDAFTKGLKIKPDDEDKVKSILGSGSMPDLLGIVMANNKLGDSELKDALAVTRQFSGLNLLAVAAAAEKFCYVDKGWLGGKSYEFNADGFKDYLQTLKNVTSALNNNAAANSLSNHDFTVLQQYNAITGAKVKQSTALANWEKVYNYAIETGNITNGYASQIVQHGGQANRGYQAIYYSGAATQHDKMIDAAQKALNATKY